MDVQINMENPRDTVERIALVLSAENETLGRKLRTWAKARTDAQIRDELDQARKGGARDEWEYLHALMHGKPIRTETVAPRVSAPPPHIFGERRRALFERMRKAVHMPLLTKIDRIVIIAGPPGSGKSFMLRLLCDAMREELGDGCLTHMSIKCGMELENDTRRIIITDDIDFSDDIDLGMVVRFHQQERGRVQILTCTDGTLDSITAGLRTCIPVVFSMPPVTRHDIVEFLLCRTIGRFRVDEATAKCMARIIHASKPVNPLRAATVMLAEIIYPEITRSIDTLTNPTRQETITRSEREIATILRETGNETLQLDRTAVGTALMEEISRSVVGQEAVVQSLVHYLVPIVLGCDDPSRPAGVFFFYGPAGIGKSEMGRVIASVVFDGVCHVESMNTYTEKHSVARLTGSPPGYVGYDDTPAMLSFLDANSRGVIILDEIEKAHPDVMTFLMELLEYGTIRDSHGDLHSARGFLIIMTSNVNYRIERSRPVGFSMGTPPDDTDDDRRIIEAAEVFPLEVLGRINVVKRFLPLDQEAIHRLARSFLDRVIQQLQDAEIDTGPLTEELIAEVISAYRENQGARSMRAYVDTTIRSRMLEQRGTP